MTFSLHQGVVVMSSQIKQTHSHQDTPISPYTTPEPWFSVVAPFLQFIPTASCNGIPPSPCDDHQSMGGRSERTQGQAKMAAWNLFSYICTRALHAYRSLVHCRAASTVVPLLPKATFTPSIQPYLGLHLTHPSLTLAINTFLASTPFWHQHLSGIRYSCSC